MKKILDLVKSKPARYIVLSLVGFGILAAVACNGIPKLPDPDMMRRMEDTHERIDQLRSQIEELIKRERSGEQIDKRQIDQLYAELWRLYEDYKYFREKIANQSKEENRSPWELIIWGIATYLGMHYGRRGIGSIFNSRNGDGRV